MRLLAAVSAMASDRKDEPMDELLDDAAARAKRYWHALAERRVIPSRTIPL
jgi:hypothetical protein